MRIGFSARIASPRAAYRTLTAVAAALVCAFAPGGAATATDAATAYYERSFVLAAHARCSLFGPGVEQALNASAIQARGAALRAGAGADELAATRRRAEGRAARTACHDPDLATVRGRVQNAFAGWARTPRMTFAGDLSEWRADRGLAQDHRWRLKQTAFTGASPVRFGLSAAPGGETGLTAVVSFVGRPRPYAARIVMRDVQAAPRAWLTGGRGRPLPPTSQRRAFWSVRGGVAPTTLLADGRTQGEVWTFPDAAADALERLDPRERFVVEFLFRDGSAAVAVFEAGDFGAGRAFAAMAWS